VQHQTKERGEYGKKNWVIDRTLCGFGGGFLITMREKDQKKKFVPKRRKTRCLIRKDEAARGRGRLLRGGEKKRTLIGLGGENRGR